MRWRRFLPVFLAVGVIVLVALALYRYEKEKQALPPGFVFASGRLEGDTITVATKVAGRVEAILFREGDEVEEGRLLARLSSREIAARLHAAEAAVDAARKRLEEARDLLDQAQAVLAKRSRDLERFRRLYEKRLIPKSKLEEVELAWKQARSQVKALQARLAAIRAEIKRLEAQKAEVEALLEDTLIRAPAKGVIIRKVANLGEVLSPGGVIALMVDLDELYLKAYVPEKEVGKLALGQEARIYVDAFPERAFPGHVRYIAKEAEFTPKEVQTKEARVKQVYEVKIYLDENPGHVLTPGLPADALIRVDEEAAWPEEAP